MVDSRDLRDPIDATEKYTSSIPHRSHTDLGLGGGLPKTWGCLRVAPRPVTQFVESAKLELDPLLTSIALAHFGDLLQVQTKYEDL